MWNGTAETLNPTPASTSMRHHDHRGVGIGAARGKALGDAVVVGGAGDAVDEAHAVKEHRAGEGAEQDVLEARLAAQVIALEEADEDVEREAEQLRGEM